MPELRVKISQKNLETLEKIKIEYGVSTVSEVLETVIEQLFEGNDNGVVVNPKE